MSRVAVVGSGIAGLGAARALSLAGHRVTLFEADTRFGGHTRTVEITLDRVRHGVDTGFLVFNHATYPALTRLFAALGIETAVADMSFSVQARDAGLEWSGSSLDTVFAQRANLDRPEFWRMLADLLRFNRLATALARAGEAQEPAALDRPIADFLDEHRFSAAFRDWYLLPMIACIWSCPTEQMLRFPMATLVRFCHNHGLLQVRDRPQWHTVRGGGRRYVERMLAAIGDARAGTPVRRVRRLAVGVEVSTDAGSERFDAVVFACHSDQALALLADPSDTERAVLGAIRYQPNRAVLHTDSSVLPRRRKAWAAWNYERAPGGGKDARSVCLHYLIDRLQPLPFTRPVIVSLNPLAEPATDSVHADIAYSHPVFDLAAIAAQARLPVLQGVRDTWFCGAWTGHGFHEDGLVSGLGVAAQIVAREGAAPRSRAQPLAA